MTLYQKRNMMRMENIYMEDDKYTGTILYAKWEEI